jgi:hypothetical protein
VSKKLDASLARFYDNGGFNATAAALPDADADTDTNSTTTTRPKTTKTTKTKKTKKKTTTSTVLPAAPVVAHVDFICFTNIASQLQNSGGWIVDSTPYHDNAATQSPLDDGRQPNSLRRNRVRSATVAM